MFGATISVGMEGDEQFQATILDTRNRVTDMRGLWRGIHKFLITVVFKDQFDTEGGRKRKWTELSKRTLSQRLRDGFPASPILRQTGRLRDSFINASSPDHIFDAGANRMVMGTAVDYARSHQFGESETDSPLPKRRIIDLTNADKKMMLSIGRAYFTGAKSVKGSKFLDSRFLK